MKYAIPECPKHPVYTLSENTRIGLGSKRECHVHPEDAGLCIKVARFPGRPDGQQQNLVEWYYSLALRKRRVPLDHMAKCYGWVRTNLGVGLEVELIRDADASPALMLRDAVSRGLVDPVQADTMLREVKRWALDHAVVVADLRSTNLMVRQQGDAARRLVFVDGIGGRKIDWKFTLHQRHPWLARMKTLRQWRRQEAKTYRAIEELYANRRRSADDIAGS